MKTRCLAIVLLCLLLPARRAEGAWTADIVDSDWSPSRFVAVDKMSQSFAVLVRQSPLRVAETLPCATGQMLGDKDKEGDLKTPEGVYFISRRRDAGLNYDLYGDLAFVLNFPNPMDILRHKSGHGIWIHGRGHAITPFETQGCVALNTSDIHRVDHDLDEGMPVVIADNIQIGGPERQKILKEGHEVVQATQAWAKAWQNKSEAFFDFHDPEKFSITEGEPFASFKSHKERLFRSLPWIKVNLFDLRAVPGPDYWVTYFIQLYRSPSLISQGIKRLYWQRGADGRFRIVGMEYEEMPVTLADKHGLRETATAAEQERSTPLPEGASEEETHVQQLVNAQQALVEKMAKKAFGSLHITQKPTAEDQAILDVAQSAGRVPGTASDAMRQVPPPPPAMTVAQAHVPAAPTLPAHTALPAQPAAPTAPKTPVPAPAAQPATPAPAPQPAVAAADKARTMIETWRDAWEHGRIEAYAACYAPDAVQGDLRGKAAIVAQKRRLWAAKPPTKVVLSNLTVTPHGQGFTAEAIQHYEAADGAGDYGRKTLTLAPSRRGFVITEETWSRLGRNEALRLAAKATPQPAAQPKPAPEPQPSAPVAPKPASTPAPQPTPASTPASTPATSQTPNVTVEQVKDTVEAWRKAWESGQIDAYMAFYAPDVRVGHRRGRDAVRAQKTAVWTTKPPKRIVFGDMTVTQKPDGFEVSFSQDYESRDGSRHKGRKTLFLTPSEGRLVITAEQWSRR